MFARRLAPALAAVVLSAATPARASGDICEPGWGLDFAAMPGCANMSALAPGNDTRANLILLLADRHRAPADGAPAPRPLLTWQEFHARFGGKRRGDDSVSPFYAEGEGSRCRSDAAGAAAFTAAVAGAAGLPEEERRALVQARAAFKPSCADPAAPAAPADPAAPPAPAAPDPAGVASVEGRAFAAYLRAADGFYAGRFEAAAAGFAALRSDPDPWLSETAAYMAARTAVNRLQVGAFDEYGTFKGAAAVDQNAARDAEAGLDSYLARHPGGRYAASARGLQRRVDWLAGWSDKLLARYAALLAQPAEARGLPDATLADEIDGKLLPALTPAMTRDPTLLAVMDLRAMRRPEPGVPSPPRLDLAAQRDAFAAEPDLLGFLEGAAAFYGAGDAAAVLRGVADDTRRRGGDHLWFSRQMLRGQALERVGDRNARGFWKELIPGAARPLDNGAAQLALALDDERRRDLQDAFAPGSPLTDPAMRAILLVRDAGPDLLRARAGDDAAPARERAVALFTLLRKELARGDYAAFLADAARVPAGAPSGGPVEVDPLGEGDVPLGLFARGPTADDIACPALADTVARLARAPGGARDRLCLGEWIRLSGFDPDPYDRAPAAGELGAGPSAFPDAALSRGALYRAVIADRAAPAPDRAYALFRAVKCYEPAGVDGCGGPEAPKAERRRWHDVLKRDYPGTRWAKALRYWW